ncbi:MAG: nucleoside-diphosphate kinase [Candidatus Paceibacterota bacterium]
MTKPYFVVKYGPEGIKTKKEVSPLETLVILKPGWEKNDFLLYGIANRLISKNKLEILLKREFLPDRKFWESFYLKDAGTGYFEEMIQYLLSSKSNFFILKGGDNIIELARGRVTYERAKRRRKSSDIENFVHTSDSKESAEREIKLVREFLSKE